MKGNLHQFVRATSSFAVLALGLSTVPVLAQDSGANSDEASQIIVTAQKRTEKLIEAPQTVNVVTGEQIDRFNITNFEDVVKLVPGLEISKGDGRQQAVALRGVAFDSDTGTNPTVDLYLNEVPLEASQALTSMFDVGAIQVLRGPQGTLRGGTGPSGAVLIGTRTPDLGKITGDVTSSYTDRDAFNIQGGVSIPLVKDVLALRVAGLYDDNRGLDVHNIVNGRHSSSQSHAGRVTLLFQPTPDFSLQVMHQRYRSKIRQLASVASTPGLSVGPYGTIGIDDRISLSAGSDDFRIRNNMTIVNGSWDFAGHRLSYVGSYQQNRFDTERDLNRGGVRAPAYLADPGFQFFATLPAAFGGLGLSATQAAGLAAQAGEPYQEYQRIDIHNTLWSHEVRFERTGDHFWNYRFGVYFQSSEVKFDGMIDYTGANGNCLTSPGGLAGLVPVCFPLGGGDPAKVKNRGYFTTQTFNFTDNDTLDLGVRYSTSKTRTGTSGSSYNAWTGTASYKHKFDGGWLAYANWGRSFRPGGTDATGLSTGNGNIPDSFFTYKPEKSNSFEAGVKGELLGGKMIFTLSAFYQKFNNFINRVNNISCTGNPNGTSPTGLPNAVYATSDGAAPNGANLCMNSGSVNLTYNADAIVKGLEMELRGQLARGWAVGLTASYADAHYADAPIPCNDYNGDGVANEADLLLAPAVQRGKYFSTCNSNGSLSGQSKFQFSVNSEYRFELSDDYSLFIRGLGRFRGKATNANTGISTGQNFKADAFVGLTMPFGLEVSGFVRNLTNKKVQRIQNQAFGILGETDNYSTTQLDIGREFGVQARFNF